MCPAVAGLSLAADRVLPRRAKTMRKLRGRCPPTAPSERRGEQAPRALPAPVSYCPGTRCGGVPGRPNRKVGRVIGRRHLRPGHSSRRAVAGKPHLVWTGQWGFSKARRNRGGPLVIPNTVTRLDPCIPAPGPLPVTYLS